MLAIVWHDGSDRPVIPEPPTENNTAGSLEAAIEWFRQANRDFYAPLNPEFGPNGPFALIYHAQAWNWEEGQYTGPWSFRLTAGPLNSVNVQEHDDD